MRDVRAKTEKMLEDCESAATVSIKNGGPDYDMWELDFLASIRDQFDERGRLTDVQRGKLEELWEKI
jgi:hypothetical protein